MKGEGNNKKERSSKWGSLSLGWSFIRWSLIRVFFHQDGLTRELTCMHCVYLALWTRKVLCGSFLCAIYKFSFIHHIRVVFHQDGLSSRQSFIRESLIRVFITMVFHQGGLSSGWLLIRVVSHQGTLSSGWFFISVVFHQWFFISVVCH